MSSLRHRRGSLCLDCEEVSRIALKYLHFVPSSAQSHKSNRDGENTYHITVLTPSEVDQLTQSGIAIPSNPSCGCEIFDLGLAHVEKGSLEGWYVVIVSPALQAYRKQLGLREKDLHITLGYHKQDLMSCGVSMQEYSFELLDYLNRWNDIPSLTSIVSYFCSKSKPLSVNTTPILFSQVKLLLETITYYLLNSNAHNSLQHTSLSPSSYSMKANQAQELVKTIGRYCLCYSIDTSAGTCPSAAPFLILLEDIGWHFFSDGYLVGMKFLWHAFMHKTGDWWSSFRGCFPWRLHAQVIAQQGMGKIEAHLIEWNTQYLMQYVPDWSNERLVFVIQPEHNNTVVLLPLPRNFGYTKLSLFPFSTTNLIGNEKGEVDYLIAGSAYPHSVTYLQALHDVGIRHIVTVHEQPLPYCLLAYCQENKINTYHMAVDDRTSPSLSQYQALMAWLKPILFTTTDTTNNANNNKKVLVHCQGGVGRTNAVILAMTMFLQMEQQQQGEEEEDAGNMSSLSFAKIMNAMKLSIQQTGRKMILSTPQEDMLKTTWYKHLLTLYGSESGGFYSDMKKDDFPAVDILLLCGLPASGKSTFSQALLAWDADHFLHINRDTLRDRKHQFEDAINDAMQAIHQHKGKHCLILDGCYLTKAARKQCITSLRASSSSKGLRVWCIAFDRPVSECETRIQSRTNHPTIPAGKTGVKILQSMVKDWQVPTLMEQEQNMFEQVIRLTNDADIKALLASWHVPGATKNVAVVADATDNESDNKKREFAKYPRTTHVLNLGAATADDHVCTPDALVTQWIRPGENVLIEEKVDGANLGLWINDNGHGISEIEVYNRSHSLMTGGHRHVQFDALFATWLPTHMNELYDLLIPNDEILYGEWLAMTHSVYYNALPDYFLVYDIYSLSKQCFYSREIVEARLLQANGTLQMVPKLFCGRLQSVEQVLAFVRGPSQCSQDLGSNNPHVPREGIVLRVCQDGKVIKKGKIVRGDFTANIEETGRWERQQVAVGTAGRSARGVRYNQLALYTTNAW